MNNNVFAVITSPNGATPSVQSKNGEYWFAFMKAGYLILFEGTKRNCDNFLDEISAELNNVNFYN